MGNAGNSASGVFWAFPCPAFPCHPASPLLLQGEPHTQSFTLVGCRQAVSKCRNPWCYHHSCFCLVCLCLWKCRRVQGKKECWEVGGEWAFNHPGKRVLCIISMHIRCLNVWRGDVRHVLESSSPVRPRVPHCTVKWLFKHTLPPFSHALRSISLCTITR